MGLKDMGEGIGLGWAWTGQDTTEGVIFCDD